MQTRREFVALLFRTGYSRESYRGALSHLTIVGSRKGWTVYARNASRQE